MVNNLPANAGNAGSVPESGRSLEKEMATHPVFLPGESHGQRSLATTVHGVAESQTQLSTAQATFTSKFKHPFIVSFLVIENVSRLVTFDSLGPHEL